MKIKKIAETPGVIATVIDNLESDSSTDALSAKQGKVLKDLLASQSSSKFVRLSTGCWFGSSATVGTTLTFELTESAKNYDLLFIQASPDYSGGTGWLIPNAENGNNVVITIGTEPPTSGWNGSISVWQESTDTTTMHMCLRELLNSTPSNVMGVRGVYGIKFVSETTDEWEEITGVDENSKGYATKEKIVGKLYDGRPIYERTLCYDGLTPDNTTYGNIHNLPFDLWANNIDLSTITYSNVSLRGWTNETDIYVHNDFFGHEDSYAHLWVTGSIGKFSVDFVTGFIKRAVQFTFQYSKTTDIV